ncbi:MAG: ketoacyl-ACP synthase III [Saprospiraceae bacterium]|nr:ketoacyl-ACP synthase III [Saprospiraceae bacterium]
MSAIYSIITGTGSYIPPRCIRNEDFLENEFFDKDGRLINRSNQDIIQKFQEITTIAERRYAEDNEVTSDLAFRAAVQAIKSADIDKEQLDYIIVAHNFGDLRKGHCHVDIVPTLAARVKHLLTIKNPNCIAYDLPFGCPGWLQAVIQADYYLKSGDASKILVIGAEVLSRIFDPHDRDCMLYSDGAGAVILEAIRSDQPKGILAHKTRSDTITHANMLFMGNSYKSEDQNCDKTYLKMHGRKLYQYALEHVPMAIKDCIAKANMSIHAVKKVLIHQANGKMDEAILNRLYALFDIYSPPEDIMPMSINKLGNSSVATVPTLLDLILRNKLGTHTIDKGDVIVFASVGAGMNINSVVYQY